MITLLINPFQGLSSRVQATMASSVGTRNRTISRISNVCRPGVLVRETTQPRPVPITTATTICPNENTSVLTVVDSRIGSE